MRVLQLPCGEEVPGRHEVDNNAPMTMSQDPCWPHADNFFFPLRCALVLADPVSPRAAAVVPCCLRLWLSWWQVKVLARWTVLASLCGPWCAKKCRARSQLGCDRCLCVSPAGAGRQVTVHELTHTNARPLSCPHCPMRFNANGSLRWHCRRSHPDAALPAIR